MRLRWFILFSLALVGPQFAFGLEPSGAWQARSFENLPYRILLPVKSRHLTKVPLVLFLHGTMEKGTDNWLQVKNGVELFNTPAYRHQFAAVVVVPQCPKGDNFGGNFYPNTETATETEIKVIALVRSLSRSKLIDQKRIYITGLSMGAIGAWDMIWRYPHLFAAAVVISGTSDLQKAHDLLKFPIWAFHGGTDREISPDNDREVYHFIRDNGGLERYTEYRGVGHKAWGQTYRNKMVLKWLFSQRYQSTNGAGI